MDQFTWVIGIGFLAFVIFLGMSFERLLMKWKPWKKLAYRPPRPDPYQAKLDRLNVERDWQ